MDYFNDVLNNFQGLECGSYIGMVRKLSDFNQKYLNFCSEDEQRSYGFGTTWAWLIIDRIFTFVQTIPLGMPKEQLSFECQNKTDIQWGK